MTELLRRVNALLQNDDSPAVVEQVVAVVTKNEGTNEAQFNGGQGPRNFQSPSDSQHSILDTRK
jgi:hypothetical protein